MEKEACRQAKVMMGMLEACLSFGARVYWPAYLKVCRLVFDKMINHPVGEWWPLLSREGATRPMDAHEPLVEGQLSHDSLHGGVQQGAGDRHGRQEDDYRQRAGR
jgi:hypothetical protein